MNARVLLAAIAVSSCAPPFKLVKQRFDQIKKVAVVEYGVYSVLIGTVGEAKTKHDAAQSHVDRFVSGMGDTWQVLPRAKMVAHPAYGKAKPEVDGWFTSADMRFFTDPGAPYHERAPVALQSLCRELQVDAVALIREGWNIIAPSPPGVVRFQVVGTCGGFYYYALYACDGTVVWNDSADAVSKDPVVAVGLEITTPRAEWLAACDQAFDRALEKAKKRLKNPPPQ